MASAPRKAIIRRSCFDPVPSLPFIQQNFSGFVKPGGISDYGTSRISPGRIVNEDSFNSPRLGCCALGVFLIFLQPVSGKGGDASAQNTKNSPTRLSAEAVCRLTALPSSMGLSTTHSGNWPSPSRIFASASRTKLNRPPRNFFERFGGYYGGTLNEFRVRVNYRPTAKFSISASETWDRFHLSLPNGNFSVVLTSLQANHSFNRFLTLWTHAPRLVPTRKIRELSFRHSHPLVHSVL
jgi:hypothetical protein